MNPAASFSGRPESALPGRVQRVCKRLRKALVGRLGGELVALWTYGAATFPDRPARLGDVDTHAILASRPDADAIATIQALHRQLEEEFEMELDSWVVLEADARGSAPPRHLLVPEWVDGAWALHRAHWLAGQYVCLAGAHPHTLVQPPAWDELVAGLHQEVAFCEALVAEGRRDPGHAAYAILNGCRICYSLHHRDVVVSKMASGRWALGSLDTRWHAAIAAALRVYDDASQPGDANELASAMASFVADLRGRIGGSA